MVVRLQTVEGEIKEYQTVSGPVGGGEHDLNPAKWVANCGLEWKYEPKPQEECDHLGCAIYLAKQESDRGPTGFVLFIAFAAGIITLIPDFDLAPILSGVMILLAFSALIGGLRAGRRFEELTEYRDKGTINGIKASKNY